MLNSARHREMNAMNAKKPSKSEERLKAKSEFQLPSPLCDEPQMHVMGGVQAQMLAPGKYLSDPHLKELLSTGALDLYLRLEPTDATETLLSMLAVSVASASLDCLAQASGTPPDYIERRDLNLRHGLKGAAVAAELIKVLDARRGNSQSRKVSVGSVNVEAGGQAIVGNVESRRSNDSSGAVVSEVVVHSSNPARLEP